MHFVMDFYTGVSDFVHVSIYECLRPQNLTKSLNLLAYNHGYINALYNKGCSRFLDNHSKLENPNT